jgi:hypothetical protein
MSFEAGLYHVQSVATGFMLDGNTDRKIYSNPDNGRAFQEWKITPAGDDAYHLQSVATGYVLDGNTQGEIYANSDNGGAFQKWKLTAATP